MSPTALIFIADGTEEMEFTITYDTLVRAGVKCTSVLVGTTSSPGLATCSRGIRIVPDITLDSINPAESSYNLVVVPGGAKGADTISKDKTVQNLIRKQLDDGRYIGMICAGSLAALTSKLPRQPITSHPSVRDDLKDTFDYQEKSVVVSDKLVTSRGPGTTFPFALTLVSLLCGDAKMLEVRGPMVFPLE
ncbi:DJ-1 protein [Exidia glandulosa HHB12029]|uniref:D-lactate dehydratase n=1 Tax=Exidia glandulosa HHB12029 TaxID=1314781 RepID=A0A165MQD8_EXIGL|nr:DJ-1 protein [Exidia glandulosa HHB12029]